MKTTDYKVKALIDAALSARTLAYAPYSNFKVGVALLTASQKIYTGCNVENLSYGLTICAERVAVFKAVSDGEKEFLAIAIVGSSEGYIMPCGACRQVLMEFSPEMDVVGVDHKGAYIVRPLRELLPDAFQL